MGEDGSQHTVPSKCNWGGYDRTLTVELVRVKGDGWKWHNWKTDEFSISYRMSVNAWQALKDKCIEWVREPV